ncbi:MAG: biotin/lipoyl-containing protein [Candidatus Eisenbacteria bacterium]
MAERTLIARVRPAERDPALLVVASPVVGVIDGRPSAGLFLNPFDRVGTVKILNRRYALRLPREVRGRVLEARLPDAATPVAYDEALLLIDPRAAADAAQSPATMAGAAAGEGDPDAAGLILVPAPSEGIFYRRPAPEAPVYVEIGAHVSAGTVLGMVEVMKCFNQIAYGGPGLPEKGEIVRILAEDSSEVEFGQALFWIRPLS